MSFESTVLAIAAIFEDYDSMRTERQVLFLSSLALSLLSMSCAPAPASPNAPNLLATAAWTCNR